MKMKVGFSRARNWYMVGSKVIELTEKRPYSHAFIHYINPLTGRDMVAQASHGMVNMLRFDRFSEGNIVVKEYEFDLTPDKFQTLMIAIDDNLGVPYSKFELLLIAIKKLLHYEVNIHDHDDSFICSEFIARLLQVLDIIKPLDLDYLTPSDLDTLIQNKINK